jgi:flagellar hook-length control protein FliK
MSVAPDLLLNSAAEIKPRSAPSKAAAKPAEPSRNEPSNFSQVYAKERQAQVAERRDAAAKQARESQARDQAVKEPAQNASAKTEEVADSGNDLPEEELENATLDPLLLFGMTGELPDNTLTEQVDADALLAGTNLQGSGPASMTDASFDAEQDALNQLPAVRMALNIGAQSQAQTDKGALSAEGMGQSLLASQMMAEEMPAEGDGFELGELELQGLSAKALEAMKESSANSAPENFVSKLSALSQAVTQQTSAARSPLFGQPIAMQQGGWSEAVVDRVMLMSSQNLKTAEIQLDPAELGRMEIRITVSQEQSQVTFVSPHAGVREALDSQMHRLRELFAQQGMNQVDVNVSDQSLNRGWQGQEGQAEGGQRSSGVSGVAGDGEDGSHPSAVESSPQLAQRARSLVDYYA